MQETEIIFRYHRTSIHAHAAHFQSCPYRISGEQLIIRRNSCKFHHTEFHNQMIDQLLCFCLCQCAIFQISFNIDIQERRDSSHAHRCTILCLNRCQVAKIQPLYCFFCILCRLGNIISISSCHFFHLAQCLILSGDLFSLADDIIGHGSISAVDKVFFLLFHQEINAVQSHTTVVTYDTASSISIRKTGDDLVVAGFLHLRCIGIKYSLIVGSAVFCKNLMKLWIWFVSVGSAGLFCHLDPAKWHKRPLQRLVCLKSDHLLQLF